jgi:hypothetical protein
MLKVTKEEEKRDLLNDIADYEGQILFELGAIKQSVNSIEKMQESIKELKHSLKDYE